MPMLPTRSAKEPRQSYQRWTKKMEPLIPTSSQSMSLQLGYNHQWQDVNKDCCKVLKISHTTSRVTKVAHDYLNSFAMLGHKGSWCSGCNRLSVVPTCSNPPVQHQRVQIENLLGSTQGHFRFCLRLSKLSSSVSVVISPGWKETPEPH